MTVEIDISGRNAVVTGGTRGIGFAITETLARAGANVVPTARTDKDVRKAVAAVEKLGRESVHAPTDIANREQVRELFEQVNDELGSVDIVVNNAGINPLSAMGKPEDVDVEAFATTLEVNLTGAFACTHEAGTYLLENGGGCVINVSSICGLVGTPRQHSYVASKHGLIGLTKSAALDWAPDVRVNAIAPGYVSTDLTVALEENEELYDSILSDTPLGRFADPSEVADAALYLASDMASFVTGECVTVDGGWTSK